MMLDRVVFAWLGGGSRAEGGHDFFPASPNTKIVTPVPINNGIPLKHYSPHYISIFDQLKSWQGDHEMSTA